MASGIDTNQNLDYTVNVTVFTYVIIIHIFSLRLGCSVGET